MPHKSDYAKKGSSNPNATGAVAAPISYYPGAATPAQRDFNGGLIPTRIRKTRSSK